MFFSDFSNFSDWLLLDALIIEKQYLYVVFPIEIQEVWALAILTAKQFYSFLHWNESVKQQKPNKLQYVNEAVFVIVIVIVFTNELLQTVWHWLVNIFENKLDKYLLIIWVLNWENLGLNPYMSYCFLLSLLYQDKVWYVLAEHYKIGFAAICLS